MILAYYLPRQWAAAIRARLLALGCSDTYANAEYDRIIRLGSTARSLGHPPKGGVPRLSSDRGRRQEGAEAT